MSRSLSRLQALVLGLVVLCSLALAGFGLFAVGSRGWFGTHALHVRVGFPEIRGVEVGTRVRIQGIDAGEVVAITPPDGPDEPVVLRLRLKTEYRHLVRVSSTVRIDSEGMLGGKVLEIRPPLQRAGQTAPDMSLADDDTLLAAERGAELTDVLGQVADTLGSVQRGEGTLGKVIRDPEAYDALVKFIRNSNDAVDKSKETMASIQRGSEALKKVPWIGAHIEDPETLLVRFNAEKNRRVFAEADLFDAGRAVLTTQGKEKLDGLGPWLKGLRHNGSDVVVVTFADPSKSDARVAAQTTRQQSEAVAQYLRDKHGAHKLGNWGMMSSSRTVTPIGLGTQAPPGGEKEKLPPARIEVVVFVPQT